MTALTVMILTLAALQWAWVLVYGSGPWRDTKLGWVWLFKGGTLALMWSFLFAEVSDIIPVHDAAWLVLCGLLIAATGIWLWATVEARRGADL